MKKNRLLRLYAISQGSNSVSSDLPFFIQISWLSYQCSRTCFALHMVSTVTKRHLIVKGVYVTSWLHFEISGLAVVDQSLDLPDHLICLTGFFFSEVPWRALCTTRTSILKWTWRHKYQSLLLRSVKRLVITNMSASPCRFEVMCA